MSLMPTADGDRMGADRPRNGIEFSILTSTYNRADYLRRGLETFTGQDFPKDRFEVVVADDGSTDHTRAVVEEASARMPKGHLQYVFLEDGVGLYRSQSKSRNAAIRLAHGRVLFFVSPDCLLAPDTLKRHEVLHKSRPDKIVNDRVWYLQPEPSARLDDHPWREHLDNLRSLFGPVDLVECQSDLAVQMEPHAASVARRWVLLNGGFNERFLAWGYEAVDFVTRLHHHGLELREIREGYPHAVRLMHSSGKAGGDARVAAIEMLIHGFRKPILEAALATHGVLQNGDSPAAFHGRIVEFLLGLPSQEFDRLGRWVLTLRGQHVRTSRPRWKLGPGAPELGDEPWPGLSHLVEWGEAGSALDWLDIALRDDPADPRLRREREKLLALSRAR